MWLKKKERLCGAVYLPLLSKRDNLSVLIKQACQKSTIRLITSSQSTVSSRLDSCLNYMLDKNECIHVTQSKNENLSPKLSVVNFFESLFFMAYVRSVFGFWTVG